MITNKEKIMKYDSLNKSSAKEIRQLLDDVLTPVLKEHNLELAQGNLTYCDDYIRFAGFTIKVIGSKSQEMRALEDYNRYMSRFPKLGKELDIQKIASLDGRDCKVVGFKSRSKKYPFIIEFVNDGKQAKITEETAQRYFGI